MVKWPMGWSTIGPTTIDTMTILDGCNWELSVEISFQRAWETGQFGRPLGLVDPSTETNDMYGRHNNNNNNLLGNETVPMYCFRV